ncbi:histone acetylation protein-domain-containing protein [Pavlovales sp. CCMP2436]|nr:histone acetylation protein-domain-containing protein [Pavlovales sp. CCMP2436]
MDRILTMASAAAAAIAAAAAEKGGKRGKGAAAAAAAALAESNSSYSTQGAMPTDILFFAMYVQEYDERAGPAGEGRVSLSYIDSLYRYKVRHFNSSPSGHRSTVYHALINAYLANARQRGYTHAHIWVSPPKPGDDFIFHCHPEEMYKRMGLLKLKAWYESMLRKAKAQGIVSHYGDMWEQFRDATDPAQVKE